MEWGRLLNLQRLNEPDYVSPKHRPIYSQDQDRILFSQPFRRLANKTQVHPLYDNDHIHHRLIHSLEVSSVGRSLAIEVGSWLAEERKEIEAGDVEILAGLVQTACLAHDIGNPPFGHSGEEAIGSWFRDRLTNPTGALADLTGDQRLEFEAFEGNAQGFRILTRTEMYKDEGGLRLALGSLGAFTKYPVSAGVRQWTNAADRKRYIGVKKYGFFENDIATFAGIAEALGLDRNDVVDSGGKIVGSWWRRHPLAFLMEAADDVCYNVMDLEDAYLAGDLEFSTVRDLLVPLAPKSNKSYADADDAGRMSRQRAQAITGAVGACVEAFKKNYPAIMSGEFAVSLIEASAKWREFKAIKDTARNRIFNARRKTELEVYGRNVVYRVLDGLLPLVDELREANWKADKLGGYHVQLGRALGSPIHGVDNAYDALHAMTDFVSGMTDRYAVKVADMIGRS